MAPFRSEAVAIIALAIFLIFLLPVSHLIDIGALLAERFLLAPSLGFILLIALMVVYIGSSTVRSLARLREVDPFDDGTKP